jgi:predicted DCC family thiol-disulfide oxidoreductase YuxK
VRFVLPRDRRDRFRFAPLQSAVGARLLAASGRTATMESLVLIEDGRHFERSDAVLRIARGLGLPWRLASALWILPRPIRDAFYDWFARRRYRWFGRKDRCDIPPPEWKARFLE